MLLRGRWAASIPGVSRSPTLGSAVVSRPWPVPRPGGIRPTPASRGICSRRSRTASRRFKPQVQKKAPHGHQHDSRGRGLRLALDDILVGDNVCDIDQEHVDSLARSIALRGLLVPLIVRPTNAGYELDVGYHATGGLQRSTVSERRSRRGRC